MNPHSDDTSHWEWVCNEYSNQTNGYEWEEGRQCSKCKSILPELNNEFLPPKEFKFCPYCGAKIELKNDRKRCEGCIAFVNGKCCVVQCEGKIVRIHKKQYTLEQARKFYTMAIQWFDDYFNADFEDEDLEE